MASNRTDKGKSKAEGPEDASSVSSPGAATSAPKKAGKKARAPRKKVLAAATALIPEDARIKFGREVCGNLETADGREWLVTNGIGGVSSGNIFGHFPPALHRFFFLGIMAPRGG